MGLQTKLKQDGCLRPDRWTVPILLVVLLAWTILLLLWAGHWNLGTWYQSYQSMGAGVDSGGFRFGERPIWSPCAATSAWVHGLTPLCWWAVCCCWFY